MFQLDPYSDAAAFNVLSWLDPADHLEAELIRGQTSSNLQLFSEWRSAQAVGVLSHVICDTTLPGNPPFAVLVLAHSGQAGVAEAAFLSKSHRKHRRAIVAVAREIRTTMPLFCAEMGIRRIEARCWADHPRAPKFLTACGFHLETQMPGFGGDGRTVFSQFAWTGIPTQNPTAEDQPNVQT